MEMMLKKKNTIPDNFLPLAMAVIGDPGDDVEGVKGIGPASFLNIFEQLTAMTGDLEQIYNKIESNKDLFDFIPPSVTNKKLQSIIDAEVKDKRISKNLRLVSFELISRAIENPMTTELRDKRLIIENNLKANTSVPLDKMKDALVRNNVFLEESSIDFLYI